MKSEKINDDLSQLFLDIADAIKRYELQLLEQRSNSEKRADTENNPISKHFYHPTLMKLRLDTAIKNAKRLIEFKDPHDQRRYKKNMKLEIKRKKIIDDIFESFISNKKEFYIEHLIKYAENRLNGYKGMLDYALELIGKNPDFEPDMLLEDEMIYALGQRTDLHYLLEEFKHREVDVIAIIHGMKKTDERYKKNASLLLKTFPGFYSSFKNYFSPDDSWWFRLDKIAKKKNEQKISEEEHVKKRDFHNELIKILQMPEDSSINDIMNHISKNSYSNPQEKNIIYQYLRSLARANEESSEKIYSFLKMLKKSRFKTFKINIANAFFAGGRFEGSLEIILNQKHILKVEKEVKTLDILYHVTRIENSGFIEYLEKDVENNDKCSPDRKYALLTLGCGCMGCCPTLFWDVRHKKDKVLIENIFWFNGGLEPEKKNKYESEIGIVNKKDFISEIKRLKEIYGKSVIKTNEIPWKKPSKKRQNYFASQKLTENIKTKAQNEKSEETEEKKQSDLGTEFNTGVTYYEAGDFEEALTYFEKTLAIDSDAVGALSYKGNCLLHLEKYGGALEVFNRCVELSPLDVNVWSNRGTLFLYMHRYEDAIKSYDKGLEINPNHKTLLLFKGGSYLKWGKFEKALAIFDKVIGLDVNSETVLDGFEKSDNKDVLDATAYLYKAKCLEQLERYDEALAEIEVALLLDKNSVDLWFTKASVLKRLKRYEEAYIAFDKVVKINEDILGAAYERSLMLYYLGRHDDAQESFRAFLEYPEQARFGFLFKGFLFDGAINAEEVASLFRLLTSHGESQYWYDVSYWEVMAESLESSLKSINKGLNDFPDDLKMLKHKAQVFVKLKKYEKALALYRDCYERSKDEKIKEEINTCLAKMKKEEDAGDE